MATTNADNPSSAAFQPIDKKGVQSDIQLPNELWMSILESRCMFPADIFFGVMLNLVKNPNITSSHLFRADVFYDSENDRTLSYSRGGQRESSLTGHLKQEFRPLPYSLPGHDLVRTIVRQLVPRNPQLDRALIQTCHFFNLTKDWEEQNVVVYMPHVQQASEMPFYHPEVSRLGFVHNWDENSRVGTVSISYCLFADAPLTTKLERTALRLLQTVHKHGQGQLAGYEKKVHLDQTIPQKRYQDTYARLKAKYAKHMSESWIEVTDPGKHVFEDIGIAAFLIELWRDVYELPQATSQAVEINGRKSKHEAKTAFPGFVDIGCGNGVLVFILVMEGYEGWGFDARERKTWRTFPEQVQSRLERRLLVPRVFQRNASERVEESWHDGQFMAGTFIISNHADELTAWTPLLAYCNQSAFIAIPCCSHDLAGARFRAPVFTRATANHVARLPQQVEASTESSRTTESISNKPQAAETGSLERTEAQKKVPSAYSTLCSYVTSLAGEVGFVVEKDVLRIPSTRNHCIIGRYMQHNASMTLNNVEILERIIAIIERELRKPVDVAAGDWIQRIEKLAKKPSSGH